MNNQINIAYLRKLTSRGKEEIKLSELPEGVYTYYFGIVNPFSDEYAISIKTSDFQGKEAQIKSSQKHQNFNVSFVVDRNRKANNLVLSFELTHGKEVFLVPSLFPQLINENTETGNHSFMSRQMINSLFISDVEKREQIRENYRPIEMYTRVFKEVQLQNELKSKAYLQNSLPVFYELINLETAKKQLDYVVYNKLYAEKKGGFFKRVGRKISRKFIVSIYKLLTRSENRKNYIAKVYRNYVNVNYLSERK